MVKFKKRPTHFHTPLDGIPNVPSRPGRRIVGDVLPPDSPKTAPVRRIDDFTRPSGYHPTRPTVDSQLRSQGLTHTSSSSLLNPTRVSSTLSKNAVKKKRTTFKQWRRRLKYSVALICITGISTLGVLFVKGYLNLDRIFGGSSSILSADVTPTALTQEGDGRINILLLGIGGEGHDGPDLTDTMLLVSIDQVNRTASLLSIPRDLWVKIPSSGSMRLNAVYETGKWNYLGNESSSNANHHAVQAGFDLVNQTVGSILGIPIRYDALVDFQAFQQVVNTLGGVSVTVPTPLYDPTIAWENNNNPIIARQGAQTFNGAQALLYVRSRETSSDFARTQRQRLVLMAIKDKVLSLGTFSNPVKLVHLTDTLGNNVVTNISITDAKTIYHIINTIGDNQIQSIGLADPPNNYVTTDQVAGQSVVRPTSGFYSYGALHYFVRTTLRDGYLAKENATIMILNGSGQSNVGAQEANVLQSYGYTVNSVGTTAALYPKTLLIDTTSGADKYTKHYLELRLKVKARDSLPDNSIQPGTANFVIILGQDESNSSQN